MKSLILFLQLSFLATLYVGADDASSAPSDNQESPAYWLEEIKTETADCKKYEAAHPDETKLLYGATQSFLPDAWKKGDLSQWPPEYRDGWQAVQAWWKSEGQKDFDAWRKAGFPVQMADRHFLIFHAVAMGMYLNQDMKKTENKDLAAYGDAIVSKGKQLIGEGITNGGLSRSELDQLRLFAMFYYHIHYQPTPTLPSYLGLMPKVQEVGAEAPDFTLPGVDEIFARSSYSDEDPVDEMTLFRPSILTEMLQMMSGYKPVPDGEKTAVSAVQAKPYEGQYNAPVTLSSFRGKKPVMFMFEDPSDSWVWSGMVAPLWEPLYEAIKDKVAVFFIDVPVTDQVMPAAPGANAAIPGQRARHPASLEAKARMIKMAYMAYPTLSIPYLPDDLGEHVENGYGFDGGGSGTYLVDKNGIISFSLWKMPEGKNYIWLDSQPSVANGPNPYNLPARNQRAMNLVEANLKPLLDAGGVWSKDVKFITPDWKMSPTLENVVLTGVDPNTGLITLKDKEQKPLAIAVDGQTRILRDQDHLTLNDLKIGQTVSLYYKQELATSTNWIARLIVLGPSIASHWQTPATWAPAVVDSIDPDAAVIRARVTLSLADCKGAVLWNKASPELVALFGSSATTIPQAFKNLADQTGQVLNLHVDRATEVFLNGMTAQFSDLQPGDHIGFELPNDFKPDAIYPNFIRVYRY